MTTPPRSTLESTLDHGECCEVGRLASYTHRHLSSLLSRVADTLTCFDRVPAVIAHNCLVAYVELTAFDLEESAGCMNDLVSVYVDNEALEEHLCSKLDPFQLETSEGAE